MQNRIGLKTLPLVLLVFFALLTMGDVNLQTASANVPVDIGQTITTVGQYGLLAWLIIRAENRMNEQQSAWRDERRWLVNLLVSGVVKPDEK